MAHAVIQSGQKAGNRSTFEVPLGPLGDPVADLPAPSGFGAKSGGLPAKDNGGSANSVLNVAKSGDQQIDGLLSGVKWGGASITYSDPDSKSDYQSNHPEAFSNFQKLTSQQIAVVHATLNADLYTQNPGHAGFSVEGFTNLGVDYAGAGSGSGTIRYANTSNPGTAYAYYPSTESYGGDVFFGPSGKAPTAGNYDYHAVIHETGHALGLKHGHETSVYGALPYSMDSMEYSAMTYKSFVGSDAQYLYNETWGFAQSFMMLDIAALQHMYGADFSTNSGDTVYSWSPTSGTTFVDGAVAIAPGGNRIFMTVWDGGGKDTYDMSAYATNLAIDLNPGKHSTFSSTQLADLDAFSSGGLARGNVFNALLYKSNAASLIENAIGGSGNDTIIGNAAANSLYGNGGGDTLKGGVGGDSLYGGTGVDTMEGGTGDDFYYVDSTADKVIEASSAGKDTVYATASFTLGSNVETLALISGGGASNGTGNSLGNLLIGNDYANTLKGLGGNDILLGGDSADILIGGTGKDIFRFVAAASSIPGALDKIKAGDGAVAFEKPGGKLGDRIDVSKIDADATLSGIQHFKWGGTATKTKGYLWAANVGTETHILGNTDSDAAAEFEVAIVDGSVTASKYAAADFLFA